MCSHARRLRRLGAPKCDAIRNVGLTSWAFSVVRETETDLSVGTRYCFCRTSNRKYCAEHTTEVQTTEMVDHKLKLLARVSHKQITQPTPHILSRALRVQATSLDLDQSC